MRSEFQTTGRDADRIKRELAELRDTALRLGNEVERGTSEWARYRVAARSAQATIDGMEGRMSRLGLASQVQLGLQNSLVSQLYRFGPAGDVAASSLGIVAGGTAALSTGALAATGGLIAIAGAGYALTRRGIPQVKQMQEAVNILAASGNELPDLEQRLRTLQQEGGRAAREFSRAALAGALAETVKAGVDANDAMTLLATGVQFAAAEHQDLTLATGQVLKNLRQFGLDARDAARAGDALAQAGLLAAGTATDLSVGLATVGPLAHAAGLTLEETLGILVELDNKGLSAAEEGATGLRNVLAALADPTGKARDTLNGLGIALETADGKARPTLDVLKELRDALSGNEEAARRAAEIFDTRGVTAILAITGAADKFAEKIEDGTGALRDYADTVTDESLQAAQDRLGSALDDLSKTFTVTFADNIANAADSLSGFIRELDTLASDPNLLKVWAFLDQHLNPFTITGQNLNDALLDSPAARDVFGNNLEGVLGLPGSSFGGTGQGVSHSGEGSSGMRGPGSAVGLGVAPFLAGSPATFSDAVRQANQLTTALEAAKTQGADAWLAAREALSAFSAASDQNALALQYVAEQQRIAAQAAREAERAANDAAAAGGGVFIGLGSTINDPNRVLVSVTDELNVQGRAWATVADAVNIAAHGFATVAGAVDITGRAFAKVTPAVDVTGKAFATVADTVNVALGTSINDLNRVLVGTTEPVFIGLGSTVNDTNRVLVDTTDAVDITAHAFATVKDPVAEARAELKKLIGTMDDVARISHAVADTVGGEVGQALGFMADGLDSIVKIASGDIIGGVVSAISLLASVLGDLGNGIAEIRKQVKATAETSEFLSEGLLQSIADANTERVSRGGLAGLLGFTKAELNQALYDQAVSLGNTFANALALGLEQGGEAFGEALDKIILRAVIKSLIMTEYQDEIKAFIHDFQAAAEGGFTQNEINDLRNQYGAIAGQLEADRQGLIDIGLIDPDTDTPTNPTPNTNPGISIPVAPTPVLAAPDWVPEFGGYVGEFGISVSDFRQGVRELRSGARVSSALRGA